MREYPGRTTEKDEGAFRDERPRETETQRERDQEGQRPGGGVHGLFCPKKFVSHVSGMPFPVRCVWQQIFLLVAPVTAVNLCACSRALAGYRDLFVCLSPRLRVSDIPVVKRRLATAGHELLLVLLLTTGLPLEQLRKREVARETRRFQLPRAI
jgi:hypothetical protein